MTKFYTERNLPLTYIYTEEGEEPVVQNNFFPVNGIVTLVAQSADLYTEIELPLRTKDWFRDAQDLGNGWWLKDEQFFDSNVFDLSDIFKELGIELDPSINTINSVLLKGKNNVDHYTQVMVRVILHDPNDLLEIDEFEGTKVIETNYDYDQFNIAYEKLLTREELLQVASKIISRMK